MRFSDIIIILLFIFCIISWILNYFRKCPSLSSKPMVVYKYRPELDLQFNEENMPLKVYKQMFTGPNVYQGGYFDTVQNKSDRA